MVSDLVSASGPRREREDWTRLDFGGEVGRSRQGGCKKVRWTSEFVSEALGLDSRKGGVLPLLWGAGVVRLGGEKKM
jgi:hypothetical protein